MFVPELARLEPLLALCTARSDLFTSSASRRPFLAAVTRRAPSRRFGSTLASPSKLSPLIALPSELARLNLSSGASACPCRLRAETRIRCALRCRPDGASLSFSSSSCSCSNSSAPSSNSSQVCSCRWWDCSRRTRIVLSLRDALFLSRSVNTFSSFATGARARFSSFCTCCRWARGRCWCCTCSRCAPPAGGSCHAC